MTVPFLVVLPDPTQSKLALVQNNGHFRLPQFQREQGARFNFVASVNAAVSALWGIPVTVSRCLVQDAEGVPAVFALHTQDTKWQLPAESQWVEVNRLKEVSFEEPSHRQAVLDWLASEANENWRTVPWSSPHWYTRATAWIRETVVSMGSAVLSIEQHRTWALSCILRVSTTAGVLFFKAVPDYLGHDPILCMYMQQYFPQYMVEVAAIEPQEHWSLTREWAGVPPVTADEWKNVLRAMIVIQEHCRENLDELLLLGCHDRRLERLPELLMPILDDLKNPQMRDLYAVNEAQSQELDRRIKKLPELTQRLASCGIPETLIHGDLWGSNVIVEDKISGKAPIIFDWTDASVTHPFFDIYCVITSEPDENKRAEQKSAHLDIWSEVYPRAAVVQAFELSQQVAPFYYLLAFRNVVWHAPVEARWELLYLVRRFTTKILELAI